MAFAISSRVTAGGVAGGVSNLSPWGEFKFERECRRPVLQTPKRLCQSFACVLSVALTVSARFGPEALSARRLVCRPAPRFSNFRFFHGEAKFEGLG
jgi:hypothetical protein